MFLILNDIYMPNPIFTKKEIKFSKKQLKLIAKF